MIVYEEVLITINVNYIYFLLFPKYPVHLVPSLTFNRIPIHVVHEAKFRGVWLDGKLNIFHQIDYERLKDFWSLNLIMVVIN